MLLAVLLTHLMTIIERRVAPWQSGITGQDGA
jgi:hypothetical protein